MKSTTFRRVALLVCVALTADMALSGCEKEKNGGTIRLKTEKLSHNSKTYVDGTNMGWVDGDLIKFNGYTYTVSSSIATGIPEDVDLIAFYPNTISDAEAPASSVSVTVPSDYTYTFADGHQILALPLVGKAAQGAASITMKHICSAMQVTVTNGFSEGLVLDSIILRRAGLSGTTTVTWDANDNPTTTAGSNNFVLMEFINSTISAGGSLTVQIPVLPVASGTAMYVSVRGHLATSGTIYRYKRSTTIAMGRATVHAAPVSMATNSYTVIVPSAPTGAINGLFSISSSQQVYFSKGNLQYKNGTGWRFAEHQYDYIGAWNTSNWVDLFGWGTWTGSNNPLNTSGSSSDYSWNNADFGRPISGVSDWRTLSQNEWTHLLKYRTTRSGKRWAMAQVDGKNGLILLPDNWNTAYYNLGNLDIQQSYNGNTISAADWVNIFEAHGAVFLPAAGKRSGTSVSDVGSMGNYWSSNIAGSGNFTIIPYIRTDGQTTTTAPPPYRGFGYSVRLVKVK